MFESPAFDGHEWITAIRDEATGLRSIVAIHSSARGPAAGGCRMLPYPTESAALEDCLRLSRAMSLKCAIADLDLGGGWSVIIGDGQSDKTPELFEAYGRMIEGLGGKFWAIVDVGTTGDDLAHARRRSRFVTGVSGYAASAGDPGPATALGVFRSVELCVRRQFAISLEGVRVAVQGLGHVGGPLVDRLCAAGADLVVADLNPARAEEVARRTSARIVGPDQILSEDVQVFCPCALGGVLTSSTLDGLRARIVVGGANNQLATPEVHRALHRRGIVYAPDYVANAGGIIAIAGEIRAAQLEVGFDPAWVESKIDTLIETLSLILDLSVADDRAPQDIADAVAADRLRVE